MSDKKNRGSLLLVVGIVLLGVLAVLAYLDATSDLIQYSMALLVVLGLLAMAFLVAGLSSLVSISRAADEGISPEPVDYRHTYRVFGLLAIGLLGALVARSLAVPDTFGEYGYYRGDAPAEARQARTPLLQGKEVCVECHDDITPLHKKDLHGTVQCEVCHGPADQHVKHAQADDDVDLETTITVPDGKDVCLICHRALYARPGPFPQVSWKEHMLAGGVKKESLKDVKCMDCHNPHEPLYVTRPVADARMHPLIHRCRDCHVGRDIDDKEFVKPDDHPDTFECSYCHESLTVDIKKRKHADVECTNCHLFQRESDFSGRIIRNTDPRFCLLCHAKADFRSDEGKVKLIDWPDHMTEQDASLTDEMTPCVQCHAKEIHGDITEAPAQERR